MTDGDLDIGTLVRRFDAHLTLTGCSERTRHAYRREVLNYYVDHCALHDIAIVAATRAEVEDYLAALPAHGSKRGDAMRALKRFYAFVEGEHRIGNPAGHLRIPRPRVRPAPHLAEADVRRLLRAAFRHERRRGWAMLLALHTGARVSSLEALEIGDVDLDRAEVHFRVAKGDHPYSMPLSRTAAIAARHLVTIAHDAGRTSLLGVGAARFRQWVHAAEQSAGLERVWPHLLRHEFSNRVAQAGDPEAWRLLMNHADLSQWPRYVHADVERKRSALF